MCYVIFAGLAYDDDDFGIVDLVRVVEFVSGRVMCSAGFESLLDDWDCGDETVWIDMLQC